MLYLLQLIHIFANIEGKRGVDFLEDHLKNDIKTDEDYDELLFMLDTRYGVEFSEIQSKIFHDFIFNRRDKIKSGSGTFASRAVRLILGA